RPGMRFTDAGLRALVAYSFPGNVRELRNIIERLVILTPDDSVDEGDVKQCIGGAGASANLGLFRPGGPFRVLSAEAERTILEQALTHPSGQMAATARALGLERSHLYKKCRSLGLRGDKEGGDEE